MRKVLVFLAVALWLAGCEALNPVEVVTPIPTELIRTAIAQTLEAPETAETRTVEPTPEPASPTETLPASATPDLTPTPVPPSPTPTSARLTRTSVPAPTATGTPEPAIPLADIEISVPGALSKVVSPFPLRALLEPGDQGRVAVELLGEDGRVLVRQIVILNGNLGRKVGLVMDVPFEIPTESELGRLVIYRQDEFGRTTALSSVELVLLSSGVSDLNVVVDLRANFFMQEPLAGSLIQGGEVVVRGLARPSNLDGLVAELISERGAILSQRVFAVEDGPPDIFRPFEIEIPYNVSEPTPVLLLIRERGERIPGITYIVTMEILLGP